MSLRTRVTAVFAVGAFVLSAAIALVSYQLIRTSLTDERERTAVRAASFNATVVRAGLTADDPDLAEILGTLETTETRHVLVRRDGTWYGTSADEGLTAAIPPALRDRVAGGRASVQRVRSGGTPVVVVGVPLAGGSEFYEVDSLDELARTFRTLALVLSGVALATAVAGAVLGRYATRSVLRPLTAVTRAAERIAAGSVRTRLDASGEPDLARLTRSFNHMVDELAARTERDRRFAADVSHELRSPLQTLAAAASVLTRRADRLDERSAAAATLVSEEVDRFGRLVNDLIELARSDAALELGRVFPAELATAAVRAAGLSPSLVTGDPAPWRADRRRVEQILANLIDNAVKYGGGPVAIRVGDHELVVEDEGPGVRPEDRAVIFDRFVRGPAAHARATGSDGTGLGLALVAAHAAAHGGRVTVDDRPDGGARFTVRLRPDDR
ncbi:sensor histidine kinase [Cryptosporangium phraense]|uniref:histidine kinase n=1 Tax=Cryptosporangium phraense TaxID=2593070 RepID=A0A545ATQ0_9ACTN|nr:HAMP domain-containing sensor histidine kinase [Cryptosporangium phraense]TQS44707.1 HAMP domain-containing histidine kinase [Cryptosporangium phraense]